MRQIKKMAEFGNATPKRYILKCICEYGSLSTNDIVFSTKLAIRYCFT